MINNHILQRQVADEDVDADHVWLKSNELTLVY